jgi:hypothetical protein
MHCDSSYAVIFAVEIEQGLTLAAHRLGCDHPQPAPSVDAWLVPAMLWA